MYELPKFPWPMSQNLYWSCEQNAIHSGVYIGVANNDTAAIEAKINDWQKFAGKPYYYSYDLFYKCWLYVLRRRLSDWYLLPLALKEFFLHMEDYYCWNPVEICTPQRVAYKYTFATMAFAAAIHGHKELFDISAAHAVEFGEEPEIMSFYDAVALRDRKRVLELAPVAIGKAAALGQFYRAVLEIMCQNDFLVSLGYIAPEQETVGALDRRLVIGPSIS